MTLRYVSHPSCTRTLGRSIPKRGSETGQTIDNRSWSQRSKKLYEDLRFEDVTTFNTGVTILRESKESHSEGVEPLVSVRGVELPSFPTESHPVVTPRVDVG